MLTHKNDKWQSSELEWGRFWSPLSHLAIKSSLFRPFLAGAQALFREMISDFFWTALTDSRSCSGLEQGAADGGICRSPFLTSQADPFWMERAEPWRNALAAFMAEKKLGLLANLPARMVHSKASKL